MTAKRRVSRRGVLLGSLALGLGAVGAGAGMINDVLPGGPQLRRTMGLTGPAGSVPEVPPGQVTIEKLRSNTRGQDVTLITMRPEGVGGVLPVCLALHGRGGDAHMYEALGMPQFLTAAAQDGVPPFAVVAVDGGPDSYWVATDPSDDPQRMLVEELPTWLAARGLRTEPNAVLGISMGCFGALNYARRQQACAGAAVISPALFTSWSDAQRRGVFSDEAQWEAKEPLRHVDEFSAVPLAVWCGTEDPFLPAASTLISHAHPAVSAVDSGAHDVDYWRRVLPDALRFVGEHLHT